MPERECLPPAQCSQPPGISCVIVASAPAALSLTGHGLVWETMERVGKPQPLAQALA
jgi:hypothetical protein